MRGGVGVNLGLVVLWLLVAAVATPVVPAAQEPGVPGASGVSAEPGEPGEPAEPADSALLLRSRRLIHKFDFEETIEGQRLGRFEALPEHWYIIGRRAHVSDPNFLAQPLHAQLMNRPGFSRHGEVHFDSSQVADGQFSFYLGLHSGSAGAFLEVGTLPALSETDYLITAKVRTTALKYARARLVAYFVDDRGRRIEPSIVAGAPTNTDGQWRNLTIKIDGDFPDAAWIGLQVELLQPQPDVNSPLGAEQVVYEDVDGGAWFDDIAVWQIPHVEVYTQSPVNLIRAPQTPQLNMKVRDLTGQELLADVVVYDHELKRITEQQHIVGVGAPSTWVWRPPVSRFGWYLIDMQVHQRGQDDTPPEELPIARSMTTMLYLPDELLMPAGDAERFSVIAEDLPDAQLELLGPLLDAAQLSSAVVSVWQRSTTLSTLEQRQSQLDRVVQDVLRNGSLTFSLYPVPQELAQLLNIQADTPLSLFDSEVDQSVWRPYLTTMTLRYGQRVARWQLGSSALAGAFYRTNLPRVYGEAHDVFTNLTPRPIVILPWRMEQSRRDDLDQTPAFAVRVPTAVRPRNIEQYTQAWRQDPRATFQLDLATIPATQVDHPGRINDLVQRMVYGWETGADALAIDRPWAVSNDRRMQITPDALLGAFRTTAHRLAGRQVVGRLPMARGVEAMILDGSAVPSSQAQAQGNSPSNGERGGMLVAWNRFASPETARLDMYLGPQPVAIDVWGNRTPVPMSEGRHQLDLSTTPVFIEGVDAQLALFRAAFRIDEPFIESTQTVHRRVITLRNPWPRTITGQMRIVEPASWYVQPRLSYFAIAAGGSSDIPVDIKFPVSESAGDKRLVANFDFTADQHYTIDMSIALEIGLTDIEFDASINLSANAKTGRTDAVLTQLITNTGGDALSIYAFASITGLPRQERIIARLQSGQTVVRRFTFPDAGAALAQHPARAGLRQVNGPAVLNVILRPDP